jgi:hypothetical protein
MMGGSIGEFATEQEAIDWLEAEVDDTCIDNWRIGYLDDPASMAAYHDAVRHGCCGSADEDVVIGGRKAMVGCNYGH